MVARSRFAALSGILGVLLVAACGADPVGSNQGAAGAAGQAGAAAGTAGTGGNAMMVTAGQGGGAGSAGAAGVAGVAGLAGTAGSGGVAGAAGTGGAAGSAGAGGAPIILDDTLKARVTAAVKPLQAWYRTDTGLFEQNDWWTSGNQLTSIIDYTRETGDQQYIADIDNTFQKNKGSNFNKWGYYDDDGWWALVWIKAYDLVKEPAYLEMAKTIFKRMSDSWDTKCGGGIYWRGNPKDKKNAISNSLFMQTAASLHQRIPGDSGPGSYLDWAQRSWTWFKGTGMLRADKLVIDTLDGLSSCKASGNVFSYNQGVLIGALVELADATGDSTLLDEASAIAHASMTLPALTNADGVMVEPCGANTVDCWQFKGIFFRNLLELYRVRPTKDIQAYTRKQSDTIWNVSKNDKDQIGYHWQVAFDGASARRQSSGLDALITAYAVSSPLP